VLAEVFGKTPEADEVPTVVIAFRDRASFAPFLPTYRGRRQDVDGYFQAGSDRDYIAACLGPEGDPDETLFHEYAHVLLNRTLGRSASLARRRPGPKCSRDGPPRARRRG